MREKNGCYPWMGSRIGRGGTQTDFTDSPTDRRRLEEDIIKQATKLEQIQKIKKSTGTPAEFKFTTPELQQIMIKYNSKNVKLGSANNSNKDEDDDDEDDDEEPSGDVLGSFYRCSIPSSSFGKAKLDLSKKNHEICVCESFIPTGILQIDWKYYRSCFENFKMMIQAAIELDKKDRPILEKFAKIYYMNQFYKNYGGKFVAYRTLMNRFADNFEKLCKLERTYIFSNERLISMRINQFLEGYGRSSGGIKGQIKKQVRTQGKLEKSLKEKERKVENLKKKTEKYEQQKKKKNINTTLKYTRG